MQYLLMWLEGPFQSWGASSKYGPRETLNFPTRSGIYGMILAAMGAKGPQESLLERLSFYPQTVISFSNESIMRDFHMVGSGFNERDPWQWLCIPKKQDGGSAVGGGAKMTYRYYLEDAKFAVIQSLDDELAGPVEHALRFPVYSPSLGRKSCVPTEFIFQGMFSTEDGAIQAAMDFGRTKELAPVFKVAHEGEEMLIIPDSPVRYGSQKEYRERKVYLTYYE